MSDFKKPWERGEFRSGDAGRPPRKGGFKKPWDRAPRGDAESPEGRAPSRSRGFRKPWDRGDRAEGGEGRPPRAGGFRKPWDRGDRAEGGEGRPPRAGGFRKPWDRGDRTEGGEEEGRAPFRPRGGFRGAGDRPGFRGSFRRDRPWEDRGAERRPRAGFRKPWEDRAPADGEGAPEGAAPAEAPARPPRKRAAPIPVEGGELVYGRQPVREILRAARRPVKLVVLADGVKDSDEVADIREMCEKAGVQIGKYRREDLDAWVNEANHQGVVAFCEEYPYAEVEEIADALSKAEGDAVVVVLDHVQDPQNLGSILRTCECAGVLGVVLPVDRAVGVTPAAVRASAGAAEHLKIARLPNLVSALERFKGAGAWITGLEAVEGAKPYSEIDYKGKVVLVIGSEGNGICSPVRAKCDFLAKLPLFGKVNSLNAGVAAAIALYEILRQHAEPGSAKPHAENAKDAE